MSDRKRSEIISDFINLMEKDGKQLRTWAEEIRMQCDRATQDILHQIELGDAKERPKLATQLAHIRRDRRYYKDIEEECNILADWIEKDNHKLALRHLSETLGALRKVERYHDSREYHPRIIKGDE